MDVTHSPVRLSLVMFIILGAIGALTPLAIDMYLPSMPIMAKELNVDPGAIQVTLTIYTAGFAVGQLLHGPLADSFGRKSVLIIGILLFALGSVFCAITSDVESLKYVRAAQGFAGAAAAVVIQALIRDMFDREEFARTMSFISLVTMMAPLVAPMLGGHLAEWYGWRSIFWFLAFVSTLVIVAVMWKIPETLAPENRQPLRFKSIIHNYIRLFVNPVACGLMFAGAFSFAGMFTFLTAGSFVYIDIYGVSMSQFGYLFSLNIIGLIIMTTVNGRIVRKMGSQWMLSFGIMVQLVAGVGLFFGWLADIGLWGIIPFVMLYMSMMSTVGSNSMAILLSAYPGLAGTASSLAGTLRFGTGSVIGAGVAMLPSDTAWPMILIMTLCAVLSALFYWFIGRKA